MRKRSQDTPQYSDSQKWQRSQYRKVDPLVAIMSFANILDGDDGQYTKDEVHPEEDDNTDLGVLLSCVGIRGIIGVGQVDSADDAED